MYKRISFMIIITTIICLTGCLTNLGNSNENPPQTQIVEAENYNIRFHLLENWSANPNENWDLHYTNGDSWFNAFIFKHIDLAEDQSTLDIFEYYNNYIAEIRDNFKEVTDENIELINNEFVTTKLYSGENEGMKNWYYCALIDFGENKDFAWVMFTAVPSYMQANLEMYNDILLSAESQ